MNRSGRAARWTRRRDAEPIDLAKPVYVSVYGIWTKKDGFGARGGWQGGARGVAGSQRAPLCAKAKDADIYTYQAEAFDASPNFFAAGADLKSPQQVTETNPFAEGLRVGQGAADRVQESEGRTAARRAVLSGELRSRRRSIR